MLAESDDVDDYNLHASDLWNIFVKQAERHDSSLISVWKTDLDIVIVFAGLYSAGLISFFVETSGNLQVDPSIVLFSQILERLGGDPSSVTLANFQPTSSDIRVNTYWCISLVLSLGAVLLATIVQRWVREYASVFYRYHTPLERARTCQYLFEGMARWRLLSIVNAIPTLIHVSLFLFLLGLCDYLINLNFVVGLVAIVTAAIFAGLYLFASFVPYLDPQAPYQTPLSDVFVKVHGIFTRQYRSWFILPTLLDRRKNRSMAPQDRAGRLERDAWALAWIVANLTDDDNFEQFVASIPGSLESTWGVEVWKFNPKRSATNQYIFKVVDISDTVTLVRDGIEHLLRTCVDPGLDIGSRTRRARTCMNAILALTLAFDNLSLFPHVKLLGHGLTYLAGATNYSQEIYTVNGLHHHTTSAVKWVCLMIITLRRILGEQDVANAASGVLVRCLRDPDTREKLSDRAHTGELDAAVIGLSAIVMQRTSGFLTFVPGLTTKKEPTSSPSQPLPVHHEWLLTLLSISNLNQAADPDPYDLLTWRCIDIKQGGVLFTFDIFLACYIVPGLISDESWRLLESTLSMIARSWSGESSVESQLYLLYLLRHALNLNRSPTNFIISPFMSIVESLFPTTQDPPGAELKHLLDQYEQRYPECTERIWQTKRRVHFLPPSKKTPQ